MCNGFCVAFHNDKTCFVSNCKFHFILPGNVDELLKELDKFCFTCQLVDCLHKVFKYRFRGKFIAKSGQVLDNEQRAVDFSHRSKGVERMPSIAKKRPLRRNFKKHLFNSFKKTKTMQTGGSVFAKRIEKVQKTKLELERK